MAKVLLIDDDLTLLELLKRELVEAAWIVETAYNGKDGLQLLENFQFDLIILDWQMPDVSGLEVLTRYREAGGVTPVIFLTGQQDVDKLESGLDSGADDYVTKPFQVRELMARIRSVQRRPPQIFQQELKVKEFELRTKSRSLVWQSKEVKLSGTELSILEFFFRHPDSIFAASEVFERVWPAATDAKSDTIRVHLHILRRKLALAGVPDLIKTIKNCGYILDSTSL